MKKFASVLVLALMAVLMLSVFAPALAEEAAAAATDSAIPAKAIAAAIAIAAAAGAGAIAMGISIGKATEAISRQPEATDSIRGSLMIGLVFIETAAEKLQNVVMPVEEEAPRRRTPRARKPRDMATEPLVFVETKPGDQPDQSAQ